MKTDEQKAIIGEQWAQFLRLRKSPTNPDRYDLEGGDKTALGVYNTLTRLVLQGGYSGVPQ